MEDKQDRIEFTSEDGSTIFFSVLGQVTIAGASYILVTDEETDAFIFKEISEEDGQKVYEIVEDEKELYAISQLFEETLDDIDIKV